MLFRHLLGRDDIGRAAVIQQYTHLYPRPLIPSWACQCRRNRQHLSHISTQSPVCRLLTNVFPLSATALLLEIIFRYCFFPGQQQIASTHTQRRQYSRWGWRTIQANVRMHPLLRNYNALCVQWRFYDAAAVNFYLSSWQSAVYFPPESFRGTEWVQSYNKCDADAHPHVFISSADAAQSEAVTFDSHHAEIGLLFCLFALSAD
jgi:hypothetical protein